ncbi:hypothetical protein [Halorussus amylolyticus]|uniref:hypothetical protein n=1 Tax=Halorussus amylolyticus TaxID=1126242 RepID=UPI0010482A49|nr:hypothetical protein [Halorussus amylolyticus]
MLAEIVRQAVQMFGLQGVSAGVLALLFAVALYSHKAASTGQRVVHVGSTVTHDVKIVALVLAALLVLGVIEGVNIQRTEELVRRVGEIDWSRWIAELIAVLW